MSDVVKLTVDDREIEVAKGTGLVETAEAAGIEIPVFCYEPRLGPPVGACRMCLVEVEGLPKLQAGCTLTAQDGMVVRTAATSTRAAEGQQGTLEFILVNHPLDCPVCDKGGECPLQDLTFRYGPGSTRMTFPKLTFDKPIPVSPLIALDRERCILCYRCTRFSSDVAEDDQLIARNRGAYSEIATFGEDPYRAPFSGNVIELCPVGALTSTQYRFEARPWEIQDVPTVCGLCPAGCNIRATTREGAVKRVQSRNHPEVDGGWICDKGRFTFPHLGAEDRVREPLVRGVALGLEPVSWDAALDRAEALLRGARRNIVTALSGSETNEIAYALGVLLRRGLGAHSAVLDESTSAALDAFRAPLSTIGDAELVVVVGDDEVVDRAPIVDLWLRKARRGGAEIVTIGARGSVPAPMGGAADALRELLAPHTSSAPGCGHRTARCSSGRAPAAAAARGSPKPRTSSALPESRAAGHSICPRPPTRGGSRRRGRRRRTRTRDPEEIGLLVVSGDEAAASPGVRALAEQPRRDRDHDVPLARCRLGRPRAPRDRRARARGNDDEPRGPRAAPPARGDRAGARRARVAREARRPLRRRALASRRGRLRGALREALRRPDVRGARRAGSTPGARALRRARAPYLRDPSASSETGPSPHGHVLDELRLLPYRPLFSGPQVERVPGAAVPASGGRGRAVGLRTPRGEASSTGDEVTVRSNGTSVELRARVDRKLVEGVARVADEHAADLHAEVEVVKA